MTIIRHHVTPLRPEAGPMSAGPKCLHLRMVSTAEERMMVAAVRAAVLLGEQRGRYDDHFDGNDHCATLLLLFAGAEPVGTLRCRWFANFARLEKMIVRREYRSLRALNALVLPALRLCRWKGYRTVSGLVLPEVVPYWRRRGGMRAGTPIDSPYGPMVPMWGELPSFPDIVAIDPAQAGEGGFERRLYAWEGEALR